MHEDRKVSRMASVDTHTWSVALYGAKVGLYDLHVTQADVPVAGSPACIEVRVLWTPVTRHLVKASFAPIHASPGFGRDRGREGGSCALIEVWTGWEYLNLRPNTLSRPPLQGRPMHGMLTACGICSRELDPHLLLECHPPPPPRC